MSSFLFGTRNSNRRIAICILLPMFIISLVISIVAVMLRNQGNSSSKIEIQLSGGRSNESFHGSNDSFHEEAVAAANQRERRFRKKKKIVSSRPKLEFSCPEILYKFFSLYLRSYESNLDTEAFLRYIQLYSHCNYRVWDQMGRTLLHLSVIYNDQDVFEGLIKYTNLDDIYMVTNPHLVEDGPVFYQGGMNVLGLAYKFSRFEFLRHLIVNRGMDVNQPDFFGRTLAHIIFQSSYHLGKGNIADYIFSYERKSPFDNVRVISGANPRLHFNVTDKFGLSPLAYAIRNIRRGQEVYIAKLITSLTDGCASEDTDFLLGGKHGINGLHLASLRIVRSPVDRYNYQRLLSLMPKLCVRKLRNMLAFGSMRPMDIGIATKSVVFANPGIWDPEMDNGQPLPRYLERDVSEGVPVPHYLVSSPSQWPTVHLAAYYARPYVLMQVMAVLKKHGLWDTHLTLLHPRVPAFPGHKNSLLSVVASFHKPRTFQIVCPIATCTHYLFMGPTGWGNLSPLHWTVVHKNLPVLAKVANFFSINSYAWPNPSAYTESENWPGTFQPSDELFKRLDNEFQEQPDELPELDYEFDEAQISRIRDMRSRWRYSLNEVAALFPEETTKSIVMGTSVSDIASVVYEHSRSSPVMLELYHGRYESFWKTLMDLAWYEEYENMDALHSFINYAALQSKEGSKKTERSTTATIRPFKRSMLEFIAASGNPKTFRNVIKGLHEIKVQTNGAKSLVFEAPSSQFSGDKFSHILMRNGHAELLAQVIKSIYGGEQTVYLVEKGIDLWGERVGSYELDPLNPNWPALHIAAANDNSFMIETMLKLYEFQLKSESSNAATNASSVVKMDKSSPGLATDNYGNTAAHIAAIMGNYNSLVVLLNSSFVCPFQTNDNGHNVWDLVYRDINNMTLFTHPRAENINYLYEELISVFWDIPRPLCPIPVKKVPLFFYRRPVYTEDYIKKFWKFFYINRRYTDDQKRFKFPKLRRMPSKNWE